jgi:hypothetical protein
MDELLQLLGLALPDTPTILRLKVLVLGGLGAVTAGVLLMASGVEGTLALGAGMVACGAALIALPIRSFRRAARERQAKRAESPHGPAGAD